MLKGIGVDETSPSEKQVNHWVFRRLAMVSAAFFVPFAIVVMITLGLLAAQARAISAQHADVKAQTAFVDLAAAVVAFRDSVISGDRNVDGTVHRVDVNMQKISAIEQNQDDATKSSWNRVRTAWSNNRHSRQLEQTNHLVNLLNQALEDTVNATDLPKRNYRAIATLSEIQTSDIPMLRGQLHLVSTSLAQMLRNRALTFKERVQGATIVTQAKTAVTNISDSYGVAGRGNHAIAKATTNNAHYLHDGIDPLISTIQNIVEIDRANNANQLEAARIASQLSRADTQLDVLNARNSGQLDELFVQDGKWQERIIWIVRVFFVLVGTIVIGLLFLNRSNRLSYAISMVKLEAATGEKKKREKAEKALVVSSRFREILMERAPVGIATIDADGKFFERNSYLEKFLGKEEINIIGEDREKFLAFLYSDETELEFERSFIGIDRTTRWADINITRVYHDGAPLALCMVRDITARKDIELRLNYEATHDGLTKLANRKLFRSELGSTIAHARKESLTFAVLFIDLDLFKYVNDTYGHAAGDFVLTTVSDRLRMMVRENDVVARFGGDEFAIIIRAPATLEQAEVISRAIVTSLAEPIMWGKEIVNIGSSIGLAMGPAEAENAEELMRNSDTAMYAAKQMGRGRYVIFDPEMQESAHQSAQLANDLQTALQDQTQIQLFYQPIVALENNEVKGFEVIVRWNHPVFGEIPQEEFIKVAEKSGTIRNLGRYIMREACTQFMALSEHVPIAAQYWLCVNISPGELGTPNFVESVVDVLNATHFDAKRLYLEITENNMNVSGVQAHRVISRLRDLGIHISIDDFGAGHSSLRYLQELHIDLLKVDRDFISERPSDESGRSILRAIVNLASDFNIPVVAEGIEKAEQLELIRSIGCQFAQGEVWGRPMSISKIEADHTGRQSRANPGK